MITSPRNPYVRALRALQDRRRRWQAGRRTVVTGVRLVGTALHLGRVEEVLVAPGQGAEVQALVDRARSSGVPVRQVSTRVLEAVSDVKTPQPVAAVVRLPAVVPLGRLSWRWLAVADGLQDPGNLGALVRTAHAAGFDAVVVMAHTADPFHPRAVRGSAGSCLAVPIASATPEEVCASARVWVADPRGPEGGGGLPAGRLRPSRGPGVRQRGRGCSAPVAGGRHGAGAPGTRGGVPERDRGRRGAAVRGAAGVDGVGPALVYFPEKRPPGAGTCMFWTSEFFWNVFQRTGAVWAYVVYRRLRRAQAYARFIWN